ncbi:unnamed protein product [Victoria cruziana]
MRVAVSVSFSALKRKTTKEIEKPSSSIIGISPSVAICTATPSIHLPSTPRSRPLLVANTCREKERKKERKKEDGGDRRDKMKIKTDQNSNVVKLHPFASYA